MQGLIIGADLQPLVPARSHYQLLLLLLSSDLLLLLLVTSSNSSCRSNSSIRSSGSGGGCKGRRMLMALDKGRVGAVSMRERWRMLL